MRRPSHLQYIFWIALCTHFLDSSSPGTVEGPKVIEAQSIPFCSKGGVAAPLLRYSEHVPWVKPERLRLRCPDRIGFYELMEVPSSDMPPCQHMFSAHGFVKCNTSARKNCSICIQRKAIEFTSSSASKALFRLTF